MRWGRAVVVAAAVALSPRESGSAGAASIEIGVGHGLSAALVFDPSSDLRTLAESFVVEHQLTQGEGCDRGTVESRVKCMASQLEGAMRQRLTAEALAMQAAEGGEGLDDADALFALGLKHNTDKIVHHGYHLTYASWTAPLRRRSASMPPVGMLEIGIQVCARVCCVCCTKISSRP